ncbi:MAG: hypothetical protein IT161_12700 [Bryobacterales bacterium]|nr:hypothetical protein [Bryobacterales bacterium]
MMLAGWLANFLTAYALAGAAFAIAFVILGARRLDPAAGRSGIAFRLIIAPGSAALWPALLLRWLRARRGES